MTRLRLWHAFFRPALVLALPLLLILQLGGPALALTDDQTLVVDVWRLVNESYVDSSFSGVPWRRLRQKALEKTISNRVDAYDAIDAMLAPLDDPYTRLLRPESYGQLEAATKGTVSGIGLQLGINHDTGSVVVIAPVEDSPAAEAGLVDGTLLRSINGQATSELGLDGSAALLRGDSGSSVHLEVTLPDGEEQSLDLERRAIDLRPVRSRRLRSGDHTLGYLRINQFSEPVPEACKATPCFSKTPLMRARIVSPVACSRAAISGVKASVIAAIPACIDSTLLLKVPA